MTGFLGGAVTFVGTVLSIAIFVGFIFPVDWVMFGCALILGYGMGNKAESKQQIIMWSVSLAILLAVVVMLSIVNYVGDMRGISPSLSGPVYDEAVRKGAMLFLFVSATYGIALLIGYSVAKNHVEEMQEAAEEMSFEDIVEHIEEIMGRYDVAQHPWVSQNWMAWELLDRETFIKCHEEKFRHMIGEDTPIIDFLDEIQRMHRQDAKEKVTN